MPEQAPVAGTTIQAQAAWDDLKAAVHGPIERFEWWQACIECLPGLGESRPVFVHDGGTCTAIAPLVLRRGRLPRLEAAGVRQLHEPMDFLYSTRDALARLCDQLAQQELPLDLPRVPGNSPLVDELKRAFSGRGVVLVTANRPSPFLGLGEQWSPAAHFNAGRRSDFRRAMRRAEKMGPVTFEILTPDPSHLDELLNEAYGTELCSWKARKGTALAIDPMRREFYWRYFHACAVGGMLRIAFMRVAGQAAAMQIAIEANDRLWLLKIGYNEAYAQLSPGSLLMLHVAEQCALKGIRSIEFLGSAEPWTEVWATGERQSVHVRIYPIGRYGAGAFAADVMQWLSRRSSHVVERFRARIDRPRLPLLEPDVHRRSRVV